MLIYDLLVWLVEVPRGSEWFRVLNGLVEVGKCSWSYCYWYFRTCEGRARRCETWGADAEGKDMTGFADAENFAQVRKVGRRCGTWDLEWVPQLRLKFPRCGVAEAEKGAAGEILLGKKAPDRGFVFIFQFLDLRNSGEAIFRKFSKSNVGVSDSNP